MELVCPAGNLPALKAAVDNGADAVYVGFKDDTNARHFAGLNFTERSFEKAVKYARDKGRKIFVALRRRWVCPSLPGLISKKGLSIPLSPRSGSWCQGCSSFASSCTPARADSFRYSPDRVIWLGSVSIPSRI